MPGPTQGRAWPGPYERYIPDLFEYRELLCSR